MKNCIIFITFFMLFSCSKNNVDETIKNKNDSIQSFQTKNTELVKEITELKTENEKIKKENNILIKELDEIKKTIAAENEGPSKEKVKKDLNNYMSKNGAGFINANRESYTAEYVGKSESVNKDEFIAQCKGNASYSANDMMGYSFESYDFQAEVYYKKFGNEWQFQNVNLKKINIKRE